jgi:hypothetical protein
MSGERDEFESLDEDGPAGIPLEDDAEDSEPDDFRDVTLSTRAVRELATTDADKLDAADAAARRRQRLGVEQAQRPQRRHETPQRQAARAQVPERENPITWVEGTSLEAPPCPKGFVMRWIRFRVGNNPDIKNTSKKFRQGWRPYLVSKAPAGYTPPESAKTEYGDAIAIGSLMLCILPRELWKRRQEYYRERFIRQYGAAHTNFRAAEDPRLPIHQTNRDSFTKGNRKPNVDS